MVTGQHRSVAGTAGGCDFAANTGLQMWANTSHLSVQWLPLSTKCMPQPVMREGRQLLPGMTNEEPHGCSFRCFVFILCGVGSVIWVRIQSCSAEAGLQLDGNLEFGRQFCVFSTFPAKFPVKEAITCHQMSRRVSKHRHSAAMLPAQSVVKNKTKQRNLGN